MDDKLTLITKRILDFMYFGGMFVTLGVPFIYKLIVHYGLQQDIERYYYPLCVIMMICGVLAVLIIYELRKIFTTVINNDCFVMENVDHLKKMGNYSFLIAIVTLTRLFCYMNSAVLVILIVFIIAGLFSKVLAQVFYTAVQYKLENDMTI